MKSQITKGNDAMEMKTRLTVPTEAFVRKFALHRKVSLSVAIEQIIAHVVKSGGIDMKDNIRADSAIEAIKRVNLARTGQDETEDGPAL